MRRKIIIDKSSAPSVMIYAHMKCHGDVVINFVYFRQFAFKFGRFSSEGQG